MDVWIRDKTQKQDRRTQALARDATAPNLQRAESPSTGGPQQILECATSLLHKYLVVYS
jgi:hypothetical protein